MRRPYFNLFEAFAFTSFSSATRLMSSFENFVPTGTWEMSEILSSMQTRSSSSISLYNHSPLPYGLLKYSLLKRFPVGYAIFA